jgi:peroxiredoxin
MKKLAQEIQEFNKSVASQLPEDVLNRFARSIEDLKQRNIGSEALKNGHIFPAFTLKNINNELVRSDDVLRDSKMIVAFFRGSWCPYCNFELQALQHHLPDFTAKNAKLIAISPQGISHSAELKEKHGLDYEILRDENNLLARKIGLTFEVQDFALPAYQALGIDLANFNQNENDELPIPAVFVVGMDGVIQYQFIDANYMNRVVIEELIAAL